MSLLQQAYQRWRSMPHDQVLAEMAMLFHLAVLMKEVVAVERVIPGPPNPARPSEPREFA
jgi:hypothetical protein